MEQPSREIDLEDLNKRFDKRFTTLRQKVIKILKEDKLPNHSGADFRVKGKLIDVKTDIFSSKRNGWQFDCTKQKGKIDYFLCIAKDINKKTKYMFLIPDRDFSTKYLWISPKNVNRYSKYLFGE